MPRPSADEFVSELRSDPYPAEGVVAAVCAAEVAHSWGGEAEEGEAEAEEQKEEAEGIIIAVGGGGGLRSGWWSETVAERTDLGNVKIGNAIFRVLSVGNPKKRMIPLFRIQSSNI